MIDARSLVGRAHVALVTLDTLRHDVAVAELEAGRTPALARLVGRWEERHTPGSFTYAAHTAFLAGFLPTPVAPGPHERSLALAFGGSETIGDTTAVFDAPDLASGFAAAGHRTVCIGGTGFFNPATPLGSALARPFEESYWEPSFGVTDPDSFAHQLDRLETLLDDTDDRPLFLLLNVAELHQPNGAYVPDRAPGAPDDLDSHAAALRHVDAGIARLVELLTRDRAAWLILCSDHGTTYGEDGYLGHRIGHPAVWTVPYAEALVGAGEWAR